MKENEGLYRYSRLLLQLTAGAAVLVLALGIFGYLFFMRTVDLPEARGMAERELRTGTLRFGERIEKAAHVYIRRPSEYFRGANGVLAATSERLIFIGVAPRDNLETPDAPPTIIEHEFPNDTLLEIHKTRVFLATARGITVERGDVTERYGATGRHWHELRDLADHVTQSHGAQRRRAARERRVREAVARIVAEPLYYVVRRGDAVSTIASNFGITEQQLQHWNNLAGPRIRIGDTLIVKQRGQRRSPPQPQDQR